MQGAEEPGDYRRDVDGLRAIAVLSVMVFHARDTLLAGGFLGVDIFFVISGYLISKHIAQEVAAGRFSMREFYRRRVRRIAPMMLLVVAATALASFALMTPEDSRDVAKSAVWSVASLANVYFWRELDMGYFARSSMEVPLLHLWSLGVEEQFYLLWPLVLWIGMRGLSVPVLLVAAGLAAVASFFLASRIFPLDASFAYYMLPTRLGELLLGAIVGIAASTGRWRLASWGAHGASWLGAALVAGSLWIIDRQVPFPGWAALPPTLGAALLILGGERRPSPLPALASTPLVFIGRISYSAYLWHWPLFALFRYGHGEPGLAAAACILAVTMLLAWLSYETVERPTRASSAPFGRLVWRQFSLPAALLLVPLLVVIYAPRLGVTLAPADYLAQLQQERQQTQGAYSLNWVCQRQRITASDLSDPNCVVGAANGSSPPRALLWGDSIAAHYVPMLREIAVQSGASFRNIAVGSCPPLDTDPAPYVEARRLHDCAEALALIRAEAERYPVIILSASWAWYPTRRETFFEDFEALVRHLAARGHTVVLLGRGPVLAGFDRLCRERALRVPFKQCEDQDEPISKAVAEANGRLRAIATAVPNVSYFDGNGHLCPEGRCGARTKDRAPRYIDGSHLTVRGATELGREVLSKEGVPAAFAALRSH